MHINTHSHTHWQAACSLTNNDFFSAVTLTMCISCLFFPLPFPTFPLNVIWCLPCVLLSIVSVPHSFPNDLLFPLIPNIRSNPPFCCIVVQPGKGLTSCITTYLLTTVSPWLVSLATHPALTSQRTRIMTVFGLPLVAGLPHFPVRYLGHNPLT